MGGDGLPMVNTEVRKLISRQPEIQTLLRDAMQGVICTLNERFSKMQIKEESVNISVPASDDEITITILNMFILSSLT